MTGNIRRLYLNMLPESKERAISCLLVEFDISDAEVVEKNWILGQQIPDRYQEKTVRIFQRVVREESFI
ncbi:MAG: hypothetical protein WBB27_11515 [Maribacter sp.]